MEQAAIEVGNVSSHHPALPSPCFTPADAALVAQLAWPWSDQAFGAAAGGHGEAAAAGRAAAADGTATGGGRQQRQRRRPSSWLTIVAPGPHPQQLSASLLSAIVQSSAPRVLCATVLFFTCTFFFYPYGCVLFQLLQGDWGPPLGSSLHAFPGSHCVCSQSGVVRE